MKYSEKKIVEILRSLKVRIKSTKNIKTRWTSCGSVMTKVLTRKKWCAILIATLLSSFYMHRRELFPKLQLLLKQINADAKTKNVEAIYVALFHQNFSSSSTYLFTIDIHRYYQIVNYQKFKSFQSYFIYLSEFIFIRIFLIYLFIPVYISYL